MRVGVAVINRGMSRFAQQHDFRPRLKNLQKETHDGSAAARLQLLLEGAFRYTKEAGRERLAYKSGGLLTKHHLLRLLFVQRIA